MSSIQPTLGKDRVQALDILRGFAILGILMINIQSFAMPGAAYLNPTAYGDLVGINKWVWILSHVLGDQKFITIFSILYGAGIVLVTQKAEEKTGKSAGLHYRRTIWLLVIGLIHAHIIWAGDILVPYAIIALFAYLLRWAKVSTLLIVGVLFVCVHTIFYVLIGISIPNWPEESLQGALSSWRPSMEAMQAEMDAINGTLTEQISKNSSSAVFLETFVFLFYFLWRCGGMMLIGMALFKSGVLTGQKPSSFYQKGMAVGLLVGYPIVILGVISNFKADWSIEYSMYLGSQWNYWGSAFVSFGYICMIMLFAKSDSFRWMQKRLAAVGQMALTNYISQSLICVFIFYGVGFGIFGSVERKYQILVVFTVWILQVLWSKPWLQRYKFGPLEWVWRSLTYMKRQEMRR